MENNNDTNLFKSDKEESDYKASQSRELWEEKEQQFGEVYEEESLEEYRKRIYSGLKKTPLTSDERRVFSQKTEALRDAQSRQREEEVRFNLTKKDFDILWKAHTEFFRTYQDYLAYCSVLERLGRDVPEEEKN